MKLFLTLFLFLFFFPAVARADQLQDGKTALDHHQYLIALKLLRPLADQGNAEAQWRIGEMYKQGQGVKEDWAEGEKWYRKAAAQGNVEAQRRLGNIWYSLENYEEALIWFRKAAEQGDAEALWSLGLLYESGQGVKQDWAEAYFWYHLESDRIDPGSYVWCEAARHLTPEQKTVEDKRMKAWVKTHLAPVPMPIAAPAPACPAVDPLAEWRRKTEAPAAAPPTAKP